MCRKEEKGKAPGKAKGKRKMEGEKETNDSGKRTRESSLFRSELETEEESKKLKDEILRMRRGEKRRTNEISKKDIKRSGNHGKEIEKSPEFEEIFDDPNEQEGNRWRSS